MPKAARPRHRPAARQRRSPFDLAVLAAFAAAYAAVVLVRGVPAWVHALYAVAGLACLALYGLDKLAAIGGRRRIPESTLLAVGLAGGWPGAIVAQRLFRHKTSKPAFRWRFWATVVAHVAAVAAIAVASGR